MTPGPTHRTSSTHALPSSDPLTRAAGGAAIASGIISAIGVVFLLTMLALFATPYRTQALMFGLLNDCCVAIQYLLTIPIAVALHRILRPRHPTLILVATVLGIASMLLVIALQLALILQVLTFRQQGVWVSLAMIAGVGAWLLMTGLAGRSVDGLPNSVVMSAVAVPYLGYPAWAFWLGRHLLGW